MYGGLDEIVKPAFVALDIFESNAWIPGRASDQCAGSDPFNSSRPGDVPYALALTVMNPGAWNKTVVAISAIKPIHACSRSGVTKPFGIAARILSYS